MKNPVNLNQCFHDNFVTFFGLKHCKKTTFQHFVSNNNDKNENILFLLF